MSWNIQKPGDYINGDLTVTNNITTNSEIYSLGGRLALYRTAGASYIDWSSGQNLVWRTVTSVGGGGAANLMYLNSNGLGIGTSPGYKLHVVENATNVIARFIGNNVNGAAIQTISTNGTGRAWTFGSNFAVGSGEFGIYDSTANASRVLIDSNGNVGLGLMPTAGKGCLQLISGINFPATQVTSTDANTLDDYEEGTWTPSIIGTTTTGTATYSIQAGRYTKIGNLVTVQLYIAWQDHSGAGAMRVSNLPFQASNESNVFSAVSIGYFHNVAMSAGNVFNGYVINGSQVISLEQYPTGGGQSIPIPVDTTGTFILTASYRV